MSEENSLREWLDAKRVTLNAEQLWAVESYIVMNFAALAEKPAERPALSAERVCGVIGNPEAGRKVCERPKGHTGYHQQGSIKWLGYFDKSDEAAISPSVQGSGDVELAAQYAEVYMSDYYLDRLAAEFAAIRQSAREAALEEAGDILTSYCREVIEDKKHASNGVRESLDAIRALAARAQGEETAQ